MNLKQNIDRKYNVFETTFLLILGGFSFSFPMMLASWIFRSKDLFIYSIWQLCVCAVVLLFIFFSLILEILSSGEI